MRVALLACVLVACGRGETTPKKDDAAVAVRADAAPVVVDTRPLGLPDLGAYGWRKRGGHPAFRVARAAEAKADWPTVVTTCTQALAAALGRLGKHEELLAPLQRAVAGDFGKWGQASLELAALQGFLATPTGQAWRARVEHDRETFAAVLARALVVEADGDLFAFDPETQRWHRLTRTYGAVIGALRVPAAQRLVYVTRSKQQYAVGIVDLARGRASRPIRLGTDKPITVAYQPKPPTAGVWIGQGKAWQRLDESWKLVALPAKTRRPAGPWLDVRGRGKVRLHALPLANVTADWDEHGLAGAIRIGKSNRVVSVPSPGLIDGNTAAWSADRARLAFVAQLSDECTPGSIASAAYVADAATGKLAELERAESGLAVEWLTEHRLAVAGDGGVTIYDLAAGSRTPIEGARGLVAPRPRPACTAQEPEPPEPEPEPDDADLPEPVEPVDGTTR